MIEPPKTATAPLTFQNTEKAFITKDDASLRRAYWLFKLVARPWMVDIGQVLTKWAFQLRLPIEGLVKRTIFAQFVGGETAMEADVNTDDLADHGIGTILDYSVEGLDEEESYIASTEEILKTVDISAESDGVPFCVFKPSGIGPFGLWLKAGADFELSWQENEQWLATLARMESICTRAHSLGTPVLMDAEESWMQDGADRVAEQFMARFNTEKAILFHTIQLYRHDRLAYLKRLHRLAESSGFILGVKLVRGAYMEKERERAAERGYPDPIQPDKASTDRDFDAALEFCIEHIDRIALVCGTHNEQSSLYLTELMQKHGIAKDDPRVFFAQLYGMSDHISYNLADAGYNVAKYVPYGPVKEVMPYLIRRAQENSSASGQTGRELSLIKEELKRRGRAN